MGSNDLRPFPGSSPGLLAHPILAFSAPQLVYSHLILAMSPAHLRGVEETSLPDYLLWLLLCSFFICTLQCSTTEACKELTTFPFLSLQVPMYLNWTADRPLQRKKYCDLDNFRAAPLSTLLVYQNQFGVKIGSKWEKRKKEPGEGGAQCREALVQASQHCI